MICEKDALNKYLAQVRCCRNRFDRTGAPIEMKMSFSEWVKIWKDSGHWDERGRNADSYVMARLDDLGSYEVGNVSIIKNKENVSAGNRGKTYSESQIAIFSATQKGRPLKCDHAKNVRESNRLKQKPCTVDGIVIYPSRKALMEDLGRNINGSNHPNFRYVK